MKKIISLLILVIIIISFSFFVYKKSGIIYTNSNLNVTTSFYPMYFFTSQIGGNKINVVNITPSGTEPHDYDPTPQDIIKIQKSKLLVLNGNVEPWANKIKLDLKNNNNQILKAGEDLITNNDPHIWLSPILAKKESQKIADALTSIDPINSNYYKNNLVNLETELDKIDDNYKAGLANCQTRSFVTSHSAFEYLAKDYGLNQIAIAGLSPDAEPSLSELAKITDFAKKNNVKYIFFEALVSPKLAQTIASEIGAKTLVLDPIEGQTGNNDYLTLMANNLQNLRIALQCK